MSLNHIPLPGRWLPGLLVLVTALAGGAVSASAAASGEDDFNMACAACHTIGGGRVVGPDLAGVSDRRAPEWLAEFVRSSQTFINAGDPDATALFKEYNGMIMPDAPMSADRVDAVLAYIYARSAPGDAISLQKAAEDSPAVALAPSEAQPDDQTIALGRELFQGTVRFEQGGPTCNACHDVRNDAVIGGGILARDLTQVFSTMGRAGVRAIIGQAPFPVMQAAYVNQPLTSDEITALVAFLQDADAQHAFQQPRDYGLGLLSSGVAGGAVVFGLCGLVWRGRRKASVHQEIFDRQTKSS